MRKEVSAEEAGHFGREAPQVQGEDEPVNTKMLSIRTDISADEAGRLERESLQVQREDEPRQYKDAVNEDRNFCRRNWAF
jgi:hypothetical protein